MSNKDKTINVHIPPRVQLNEDRGLPPSSTGTPMPKVKPAAPVIPIKSEKK